MKNIYDVQKQLLKEIDEICRDKGFQYFLVGFSAMNAYKNHTLKDGPWTLSLAMVQGEAEQLATELIGQKNSKRYVEWVINNPIYSENHFTYGAIDTTSIRLGHEEKLYNHGIHLNVYYIDAYATIENKRIPEKTKSYRIVRKFFKGVNERNAKEHISGNPVKRIAKSVVYGPASLIGAERIAKKMYDERYKIRGIDTWKDLCKYSEVAINKYVVPVKWIDNCRKYELEEGVSVFLPNETEQYLMSVVGEDWKEKECSHPLKHIISTEKPFEESLRLLKASGVEKEYNQRVAKIQYERAKVKDEYANIESLKQLVFMTKEQVYYERLLSKQKNASDSLIKQVVKSLKKYEEMNLTFRLNEQAEREIDSYLEREGEVELLARLQELRKVDIFAGK